LQRRLKVSTRTLAKYLDLLEGEGAIIRRKTGELKLILLNHEKADQILRNLRPSEFRVNPELWQSLRDEVFDLAMETFYFLEALAETHGRYRMPVCEFSELKFMTFFRRYRRNIFLLLLKLASLEPPSEKEKALYYGILMFLRQHIRTFPLSAFIFFPIYDIPEQELRKLSPKALTIMSHISQLIRIMSEA